MFYIVMFDPETAEGAFYPDMRDPRVMVSVPHARRAAMTALWSLAARLTKLLIDAREPLIGQIKLAWWRDMAAMLATNPGSLPRGEPLLAELSETWAGQGGLDALVDAAETVLLSETGEDRRAAAESFGMRLFELSGGDAAGGCRWGLLWSAGVEESEPEARRLLADAKAADTPSHSIFAGNRALLMLDRWAAAIAQNDGERRWRSEGMLLFRVGLLGR